jgi:Ribbon-helix-helix protein, copG family
MMWRMKRTSIYLAEGQAAALDRVAQSAGVSRSELIRELIDRGIGGHPGADLATGLAAIERSFGIFAGEEGRPRGGTSARVTDPQRAGSESSGWLTEASSLEGCEGRGVILDRPGCLVCAAQEGN